MNVFERIESEVRGYCRVFPTTFTHARSATLVDERGREYIDFFAGAGALNYGHNPPAIKRALIEYLSGDHVVHTLDMYTAAKRRFLEVFEEVVLKPRELDFKVMFPGPTGTNAVEAALKLARKATGRANVISFTNGFHGMTLGSLALTGNASKREGAGVPLTHVSRMPYEGYMRRGDSIAHLDALIGDSSSGVDLPAAVIVETVQAEGGVNVASGRWLRELRRITRERGILLIVDDIQVGCGRTGRFFSFEDAGITPDIVTLSKSLSGYGLPFAITIFRRELDLWSPGEHNGTFRGFNPAMVTATAALEHFWRDGTVPSMVGEKAALTRRRLEAIAMRTPFVRAIRGRGMIRGVECESGRLAGAVSKAAFDRGLIIETAGADDEVVKLLPPLTITPAELERGLDILADAFRTVALREEDEDEMVDRIASAPPVIHAGQS